MKLRTSTIVSLSLAVTISGLCHAAEDLQTAKQRYITALKAQTAKYNIGSDPVLNPFALAKNLGLEVDTTGLIQSYYDGDGGGQSGIYANSTDGDNISMFANNTMGSGLFSHAVCLPGTLNQIQSDEKDAELISAGKANAAKNKAPQADYVKTVESNCFEVVFDNNMVSAWYGIPDDVTQPFAVPSHEHMDIQYTYNPQTQKFSGASQSYQLQIYVVDKYVNGYGATVEGRMFIQKNVGPKETDLTITPTVSIASFQLMTFAQFKTDLFSGSDYSPNYWVYEQIKDCPDTLPGNVTSTYWKQKLNAPLGQAIAQDASANAELHTLYSGDHSSPAFRAASDKVNKTYEALNTQVKAEMTSLSDQDLNALLAVAVKCHVVNVLGTK